jgi:hypothetical protein
MQRVEYVPGWWILRALSRNPLVRGIDRLEMLIVTLGLMAILVATACAGALGTAVYDARCSVYIAQAQSRYAVTARATDESAFVPGFDDRTATRVHARWLVNGTEHSGSVNSNRAVKTGALLPIWVDSDGDLVHAPTPTSQAGVDAVGVAYTAWQAVTVVLAGLIWWGRSHLDRRRVSAWERDIRYLIDDDGGRTNRKP